MSLRYAHAAFRQALTCARASLVMLMADACSQSGIKALGNVGIGSLDDLSHAVGVSTIAISKVVKIVSYLFYCIVFFASILNQRFSQSYKCFLFYCYFSAYSEQCVTVFDPSKRNSKSRAYRSTNGVCIVTYFFLILKFYFPCQFPTILVIRSISLKHMKSRCAHGRGWTRNFSGNRFPQTCSNRIPDIGVKCARIE